MEVLSQRLTTGDYNDCELVDVSAVRCRWKVFGSSAFMRLMSLNPHGGEATWSPEFLVNPEDNGAEHAMGVSFKDAIPGSHATVLAQTFAPDDPTPIGGVQLAGTLSRDGTYTPPVSAGPTVIADTFLSAAALQILFSPIPQTFSHLKLLLSVAAQAGIPVIGIQLNGDTTANYFGRGEIAGGGGQAGKTETVGSTAGTTMGEFGVMPLARYAVFELTIPGYRDPTSAKQWLSLGGGLGNNLEVVNAQASGFWNSPQPIQSLALVLGSSAFSAQSRATLYGL